MSGTIASFAVATSAVSAIEALDFGATGGVVLGPFVFSGFEVPECITFGGEQRMDVKKLIGGTRVIDLLGPDEMTIEWSGTFIDGVPQIRALTLDQMRAAGQTLPLIWGLNFYTVLIQRFAADTRYGQVPYRIACMVVRNEITAALANPSGLLSALQNDMSSAIGVSP